MATASVAIASGTRSSVASMAITAGKSGTADTVAFEPAGCGSTSTIDRWSKSTSTIPFRVRRDGKRFADFRSSFGYCIQ